MRWKSGRAGPNASPVKTLHLAPPCPPPRPSPRPTPLADPTMPSASTIMRRRAALGFRCASGSAEEGASAAVADGVDGMALLGVARDVQPAGEAVGWTDPDPPAVAVAGRPERRGLGGDPVAEPLELAHRARHGSGAFGLRLAAVGVVLGDVRAHAAGVLRATEWPA